MPPELFLVQWAHVLAATLWLAAFVGLVIAGWLGMRLASGVDPEPRRLVERRYLRFVWSAALVTIASGALRATLLGPLRSVDVLLTPYGLVWLGSLGLTIALAVHEPWVARALLAPEEDRRRRHEMLHATGFGALISGMVLLRFGL